MEFPSLMRHFPNRELYLIVIWVKTIITKDMLNKSVKLWWRIRLKSQTTCKFSVITLHLFLLQFGKKFSICKMIGIKRLVTQLKYSFNFALQKILSSISIRWDKRSIDLNWMNFTTSLSLSNLLWDKSNQILKILVRLEIHKQMESKARLTIAHSLSKTISNTRNRTT